ncbi:MAG: hypothetical protein WCG44_02515 [bacterium]
MHAFILAGGTQSSRTTYMDSLSSTSVELIHLVAEKTTITIKQVQDLSLPLSISPRIPRLVWIEEAGGLTVPAQNALLKMLEEPPEATDFYLTCDSSTSLLPTIRSRAKVIHLENLAKADDPLILQELKNIMSLTPGDRLGAIVKRDRSESVAWLTQIEFSLKTKLHQSNLTGEGMSMLAKIARSAQTAHAELLANCSVSLVTQNFYLRLPHTHSVK